MRKRSERLSNACNAPGYQRQRARKPAARTRCSCLRRPCLTAQAAGVPTAQAAKSAAAHAQNGCGCHAARRTLCFMCRMRSTMAATSGSGPLGACAQADCTPRVSCSCLVHAPRGPRTWFGQPAHAAAFPAASELVPGQFSGGGAGSDAASIVVVVLAHEAAARACALADGRARLGARLSRRRTAVDGAGGERARAQVTPASQRTHAASSSRAAGCT